MENYCCSKQKNIAYYSNGKYNQINYNYIYEIDEDGNLLYIDKDGGFHIEYHIPKVGDKNTITKPINVLSINTAGHWESEVFALKSEIPKSS